MKWSVLRPFAWVCTSGGVTVSGSILGVGGGDARHFFLLNLYNSKNIGGGGASCSAVFELYASINANWCTPISNKRLY